MIRVAFSEWRGEKFAHYFEETRDVFQRRTFCGKSALGWETDEVKEIGGADCVPCQRKFERMERS